MKAEVIRRQLQDYIHYAKDEQLEAIYALVKQDINLQNEWWQEESVVSDLDVRSNELKNGGDQGVSWAEVKAKLVNRNK